MRAVNKRSDLRIVYTSSYSVIARGDDGLECLGPKRSIGLPSKLRMNVFLDVDEPYARRLIQRAFQSDPSRARHFQVYLGPGVGLDPIPLPPYCDFQWSEYERIDWHGNDHDSGVLAGQHGASSYCIRKGISRKAQLAHYTRRFTCKNPNSFLKAAMPHTIVLDCWSVWEDATAGQHGSSTGSTGMSSQRGLADVVVSLGNAGRDSSVNRRDRLDHCLTEAKEAMKLAWQTFDTKDTDAHSSTSTAPAWILKGSTTNKGVGIFIVHVFEQVLDHCWNEPNIREWVLQRYITNPLLLRRRKFHIRAYVVAVSAIQVYLYQDCLALCAGPRYQSNDTTNLGAHITNTAYQLSTDPTFREQYCVLRWTPEEIAPILVRDGTCSTLSVAGHAIQSVIDDMGRVVGDLFRAYQNEFGVFAPIEGCFEHYGVDFMVDENWQVYLLEVNPGPDFKQTGSKLESVIENLMGATIDVALLPQVVGQPCIDTGKLSLVYEHTGRSVGIER